MTKHYDAPMVGAPYPTGMRGQYRCFDGYKWNDCDEHGIIKRNKGANK